MQGRFDDFTGPGTRSRAALARDAALARVGRTRRWVLAAAAALTAGIAALVSAVAPGRTLSAKTPAQTEAAAPSTGQAASNAIPTMPPAAGAADLGLQGPSQAPAPAQSQTQSVPQPQPQSQPTPPPAPQPSAPVVSGGS
jgi:hypothetical protein